jgi:hypothetical protein
MAFVAGILLMHLQEEHRAFAALVMLMHGARLRDVYLPGMAALQLRLRQLQELLRRRQPALSAHLEAHDVSPVIYASSWFLSLYAAEFPYSFTARVLDVMLAERSCAVVTRVALGLLDAAEAQLLELKDFESLVMYLKLEPKQWPAERLREVLTLSISMGGITDVTLAALAEDIACDDAAAEAAANAADAETPRGGDSGTGAATEQKLDALPGSPVSPMRPGSGGNASPGVGGGTPRGGAGGHHSRHTSQAMMELLIDMDLVRVTTSAATAVGGASPSSHNVAEDDEDWVDVAPPLSGGTLGVFASDGRVPPPVAPHQRPGGDGSSSQLARPSLAMLRQHQQQEAQEAQAGVCPQAEDLISFGPPDGEGDAGKETDG